MEATIYNYKPDLFTNIPIGNPIPTIPPESKTLYQRRKKNEIQKSLMLATDWNIEEDPTGWFEEFSRQNFPKFYFVGGCQKNMMELELYGKVPKCIVDRVEKYNYPISFVLIYLQSHLMVNYGEISKNFHNVYIKLRIQRGHQQSSLVLAKSQTISEKVWKTATFCIFDVPEVSKPYEERIEFLKKLKTDNNWPSFLKVVDITQCKSKEHLTQFMKEIVLSKGEGVMLRKAQSMYEQGRSNSMRRYKEYQDTEVKVLNVMYPHGFECQQ